MLWFAYLRSIYRVTSRHSQVEALLIDGHFLKCRNSVTVTSTAENANHAAELTLGRGSSLAVLSLIADYLRQQQQSGRNHNEQ